MEDKINDFGKWNTTIYQEPNWKTTLTFWKMEDDLNFLENGRKPQYVGNWKKTSIDDINVLKLVAELNFLLKMA